MTSRGVGVVVAAATSLSLLAACGNERDNTYIENANAGVFVRLPLDWTVFPVEDGNPVADPAVDLSFGPWRVLVDGATSPSRSHLEEAAPDEPVGFAFVTPLSGSDFVPSMATLRSLATPDNSDPLDGSVPGLVVEEYDEIDLGHAWGNRITAEVPQPGGSLLKFTQLAFVDDGSNRITVFMLGCSTTCFDDHADEIRDSISSFTLEER